VESGILDERGLSDLTLPLPRFLPRGTRLWGLARIGSVLTPLRTVTVQTWEGSEPSHVLPR